MEMGQKDLGVDVSCLDMGPLPAGRQRTSFLAVGGYDQSVRVLSLEPGDGRLMELASMQVPDRAESLALVEMAADVASSSSSTPASPSSRRASRAHAAP